VETVLHSFANTSGNWGFDPASGVVLGADGNFYGVANQGGAICCGTVFELTPGFVQSTFRYVRDRSGTRWGEDGSGDQTAALIFCRRERVLGLKDFAKSQPRYSQVAKDARLPSRSHPNPSEELS